jgi:hypothetical protein
VYFVPGVDKVGSHRRIGKGDTVNVDHSSIRYIGDYQAALTVQLRNEIAIVLHLVHLVGVLTTMNGDGSRRTIDVDGALIVFLVNGTIEPRSYLLTNIDLRLYDSDLMCIGFLSSTYMA